MTRRVVVFVSDDYWTNPPKENPMTNQRPDAGDFRRASLLSKYRREGNQAGQVAIVEEVNELDRSPQLLRAILTLHKTFIERFRTAEGIDVLADYVHGIATLEGPGIATQDITRAAQILDHHGHADRNAIAAVMNTASGDGRATDTILALLDHYEVLLPELNGPAGIAFIDANAAAMRDEEYGPGEAQD